MAGGAGFPRASMGVLGKGGQAPAYTVLLATELCCKLRLQKVTGGLGKNLSTT